MYKIRVKIILFMLISLFIISFGLTFINYRYSTQLIEEESSKNLVSLMEKYGVELNETIRQREYATSDLKAYILNTFDYEEYKANKEYIIEYKDIIEPVIKDMAERRSSIWLFLNPFILNEGHDVWYYDYDLDGVVERQEETSYEFYNNDIDSHDKEWFYKPMTTKKPNWTDYYAFVMADGEITNWVTYSDAIYINDDFIGIVGADFDFTSFREQIRKLSIYKTGYTMLLDSNNNIIVHPELTDNINIGDYEGGKFSVLKEILKENAIGITEYKDDTGKEFIMAYSKIINDWSLVVVAEKDEIYKSNENHTFFVFIVILITIIFSVIISYIVSRRVSTPIEKLSENINRIGAGDYLLSINTEILNDKSELGVLARSVETMRLNLNEALAQISNNAHKLEIEVFDRTVELKNSNEELVASLRDLKTTQSRLIENKKSDAIYRMSNELSHRLNTPIGNIITTSTFLQDSIKKQLNQDDTDLDIKKLDCALSMIVDSAITSAEILNNLRKVTEVKRQTKLSTFGLFQFVEEHFEFCEKNNKEVLNLNIEVTKSEPVNVSIDVGILREVLKSLFDFSVGYNSSEMQDIYIKCHIEPKEKTVDIIYSDQGHNLINNVKDKIFEPFAIKSFSAHGDGMELYIVHNLINTVLEGNIEFYVDKENKYNFKITIPKNIYDIEI